MFQSNTRQAAILFHQRTCKLMPTLTGDADHRLVNEVSSQVRFVHSIQMMTYAATRFKPQISRVYVFAFQRHVDLRLCLHQTITKTVFNLQ